MKKGGENIESLVDPKDPLKIAVQSMDSERFGNIGRLGDTLEVAGVDCSGCIICEGTTDSSLGNNCKRSSSATKSVDDDVP